MAMAAAWRWVSGCIISLLCVALLFYRVDFANVVRELSQIAVGQLIVALLLGLAFFPARSWRWQLLFPRTVRPEYRDCFAVLAISNLVNNLVPARGGDLVRCLLMKKAGAAGASVALGTLAFEKTLDGLTLVLVLMLAVVVLGPSGWVMITALVPGAIFAGALAFLILLRLRSEWVLGLATRVLERCGARSLKDRGIGLLARFIDGLSAIESRKQILATVALTAVIWFGDALVTWWLAHSTSVPVSLSAAAVVSAIIGLGYMIPAGPAAVGTYEAAAVAGLGIFSVLGERALAFALVMHACSLILTTGLGLVGLLLTAGNALAPPTDHGPPDGGPAARLPNGRLREDEAREATERRVPVDENGSASNLKEFTSCQDEA
jgi:uncharacterized protein (TIRG00374 family)